VRTRDTARGTWTMARSDIHAAGIDGGGRTSREIQDGDLVLVGCACRYLPMPWRAMRTTPKRRGIRGGVMRDQPAAGFLGRCGRPANVAGGSVGRRGCRT